MKASHYSSDILATVRNQKDELKAAKLVKKNRAGKVDPDELRSLFWGSQLVADRDVVKAMIAGAEQIRWERGASLPSELDEEDYIALLGKGVPVTAKVRSAYYGTLVGLLPRAASEGWAKLTRRLLDAGLDVNANGCEFANHPEVAMRVHRSHLRPLHYTYMAGERGDEIPEMLLRAGAEPLESEPTVETLAYFKRELKGVLWGRLQRHQTRCLEILVPNKGGRADEAGVSSRFGGLASLPTSDWPQSEAGPLLFVGQIVLSDMKSAPLPLPEKGILYFFVEPFPHAKGRVVYRPEPGSGDGPSLLPGSYGMKFKSVNKGKHRPYAGSFYFEEVTGFSALISSLKRTPFALSESEVDDLRQGFNDPDVSHRVGGHPFLIQDDPRAAVDETVVTLLQVDQFKGSKTMLWGDNGIGHFFIGLDDLKAGNFDGAFFKWACT